MLMSTVPDLFEKLSVLLTTLTLVTRVRVESASPLSRLSGQICSSLRRWAQIDAPPQSLQMLLARLLFCFCKNKSRHHHRRRLRRLCGQMEGPRGANAILALASPWAGQSRLRVGGRGEMVTKLRRTHEREREREREKEEGEERK
jgi:hypothetical protein